MSGIYRAPATVPRHRDLLLQEIIQRLDILRGAGREGGVRLRLVRGSQPIARSPVCPPVSPLDPLHLDYKSLLEDSLENVALTLVFLVPAGVLLPLWSARLGVSPPLSPIPRLPSLMSVMSSH